MINTTANISKENRLADLDNLNNQLNTNYQLFENQSFEPKKIRKERQFLPLSKDNPVSKYLNMGGLIKGYLTEMEEKNLVVEYHWCKYHINLLEGKLKKEFDQKIFDKISELEKRRDEVRDELISDYKFLVVGRVKNAFKNLKEFRWSKLNIDDLLQAGSIGLIRSVDRYLKNPKERVSYEAKKSIHWEIYNAVIDNIRNNLPRSLYYLIRRLDRVNKLTPKKIVKDYKIPEHLSLSIEEAKGAIILYRGYISSYDRPINEEGDKELGDFIIDHSERFKPQRNEIRSIVLESFKNLSLQQRLYIALRIGVGRILDPISKEELLNITGLTKKEIRTTSQRYHRGYRLSSKENTIIGIMKGNLNGRPHTLDEIMNILSIDKRWIKAGEDGIKELKNNPILKELV